MEILNEYTIWLTFTDVISRVTNYTYNRGYFLLVFINTDCVEKFRAKRCHGNFLSHMGNHKFKTLKFRANEIKQK